MIFHIKSWQILRPYSYSSPVASLGSGGLPALAGLGLSISARNTLRGALSSKAGGQATIHNLRGTCQLHIPMSHMGYVNLMLFLKGVIYLSIYRSYCEI